MIIAVCYHKIPEYELKSEKKKERTVYELHQKFLHCRSLYFIDNTYQNHETLHVFSLRQGSFKKMEREMNFRDPIWEKNMIIQNHWMCHRLNISILKNYASSQLTWKYYVNNLVSLHVILTVIIIAVISINPDDLLMNVYCITQIFIWVGNQVWPWWHTLYKSNSWNTSLPSLV